MKDILNKALIFLTAGLLLGACETITIPELTEPVREGAFVKFFFHAEGAPRADFYMDSEKVTAVASSKDDDVLGHLYGSVYPSNAYALLPAGNFTLSAIDTASITGSGSADVLATTDVSLQTDKYYSAYLVGTTEDYEVILAEDNLPADDPVKVYWRFMNTMVEMPSAVDVYAVRAAVPETDDAPAEEEEIITLGTNIGFMEHGDYKELRPGSYTYKVFLADTDYDPSTSTPYIKHAVNVVTLGRTYTTHIRGTYTEKPTTSNIGFWRDR